MLTGVVGDFNNDGKPDLAIGQNSSIGLLPGRGQGILAAPSYYDLPNKQPRMVASAGDLDGDGGSDLATANSSAASVGVFLASGPGSYGAPVQYAARALPYAVLAADVKTDGKNDLGVVSYTCFHAGRVCTPQYRARRLTSAPFSGAPPSRRPRCRRGRSSGCRSRRGWTRR